MKKSKITDQFRESLMQTLKGICDKFHEETGEQMMIAVGHTDDEALEEYVVSSANLEYGVACKMMVGVVGMVGDYFGGDWGEGGEEEMPVGE